MRFSEIPVVLIVGSLGYGLIELLYRGFTHWSMLICGGVCFLFMYLLTNHTCINPVKKSLLSAVFITTMEFTTGIFVNLYMSWNVWDYSGYRIQLMGQICLLFTLFWFAISFLGQGLCMLVKKLMSLRLYPLRNRKPYNSAGSQSVGPQ